MMTELSKYNNLLIYFFLFLFSNIFILFTNKKSIDNLNESRQIKTPINEFSIQCENNEWISLNKYIYFRKSLAFCYSDIKKLRIYFTKHKKYKANLHFELLSNGISLKTTRFYFPHLNWHRRLPYQHGYLEADLDCLKINENKTMISTLEVDIFSANYRTKSPVLFEIKHYDQNENFKNSSIACSKLFFFDNTGIKRFKWWIEVSKLSGYEKLVIFNVSLSEVYKNLFDKYKDFVQVIQYQCIPNLFPNLLNESYFKFNEIGKLFPSLSAVTKHGIYQHYEYFSNNECYLLNKDKYRYVAVLDNDEFILPRLTNISNILDFTEPNQLVKNHNCYKDSQKFETYLKDVSKNLNSTQKNTYFFQMNLQLKTQTMKIIFEELGKILENYEIKINKKIENFHYSINVKDMKDLDKPDNDKHKFKSILERFRKKKYSNNSFLNFELTIDSKQDFIYAKYLYDSFKKLIEPFLDQNSNIDNEIDESFNRFYFILGDNLSYAAHPKTVHDTLKSTDINWHLPNTVYETQIKVPNNLGHVNHFRLKYHSDWKSYPIKSVFFDFDYFACYYLKTLQNYNNSFYSYS